MFISTTDRFAYSWLTRPGNPDNPGDLLIYLYKRCTWYPYAPAWERRDSALERQVKAVVQDDLRMEEDLSRWFAVYDARPRAPAGPHPRSRPAGSSSNRKRTTPHIR